MATLTVGAGQQFATISAAVAASHDGDVVQVQAGTYVNDFATINTKITLQGVGGMVQMVNTGGNDLPGDKGMLVTNTDVSIDHFEFSGALSSSGNGAGIRYQAGALTVTNSYFHDNQEGILANPSSTGTITIQNSEFANNGNPNGGQGTHDIYVGDIAKLTIDNSYLHDVWNQYNLVKSRAAETVITNSRMFDLNSNASYEVDISNGGVLRMENNVIQQGANSSNPNIIGYGAEGITHASNSIYLNNNTIINDMDGRGIGLYDPNNVAGQILNTKAWGMAGLWMVYGDGVTESGTVNLAAAPVLDTSHPWASSGGATPPVSPPPVSPPPVTGDQTLTGTSADDSLTGGAGADNISGGDGHNVLFGGDGNDQITGGADFDRTNGNAGDDTVHGGAGADWVTGGKDQDTLYGDDGADTVNGNLGADTADGGAGADTVRGGQGDDVISGGAGDDYITGDLGNDTMTGGEGADRFRVFAGGGVDVVTDFNPGEGDHLVLDPGTTYTAAQVGADVVLTLNGGGQVTLAHVTLAALADGWVVGG
jgi:Ca2+-binding RTX toxin-like protein